jgi:aminoglycoside phosphotransferase family enzyme
MPGSDPSMLIRSLQRRDLFPHPVQRFDVRETHISWVLLTGLYAYKIKKPLDLGFLDFSTLENRRHFCEEEVRLNKRLADDLYLEVVAITGTPDRPELNGPGPAIEYAVKMIQFPEHNQLDKVLARGELQAPHIDLLAKTVADFHAGVPAARPDSSFGEPDSLYHPVQENFGQIEPLLEPHEDRSRFEAVKAWSQRRFRQLHPALVRRKGDGYVRECHGDMHLANMAFFKGRLIVFDCIEFSENLRWIDVMSEVGFATMDLDARGQSRFGQRFLNRYLERTGDYAGLEVLRFYQTYRAMVRAKVARWPSPMAYPGRERPRSPRTFWRHAGRCAFARTSNASGYSVYRQPPAPAPPWEGGCTPRRQACGHTSASRRLPKPRSRQECRCW